MAEQITYYAIIDYHATREDPAGLVRRVRHDTGFRDEALERDLNWRFTQAIVEWVRAESTDDLIEVSEEEADRIVDRFRQEWGGTYE